MRKLYEVASTLSQGHRFYARPRSIDTLILQDPMNPIEQAKAFVMNSVQAPALAHESLPKEAKFKVRSSNIWLSKFRRVGDLLHYISRFDASNDDPLYVLMKSHGLKTFEDIRSEFSDRFGSWAEDKTRATDFIIGDTYSPHEVLIFANSYDTRSGGMFVLPGAMGKPAAVVIKATLKDGAYANEWLQEGVRLKYYLKAIQGKFNEKYKANKAILDNPAVPVLTFVRDTVAADFIYFGPFEHVAVHTEIDGSKWFELQLRSNSPADVIAHDTFIQGRLAKEVRRSTQDSHEARLARLKAAPRVPRKVNVVSTAFIRNADVIAETLYQAKGICGACGKNAPFTKASDGTPYLEVHHKIRLADEGEDTIDNAIALCPNCHRLRHFG